VISRFKGFLPPPYVVLIAGLASLSGCGNSPPPPPQTFPPLDYSYLPPIVLNIANITVQNTYVPDASAAALIGEDPEPPANALTAMLQRRLVANGTPGNGTVTIENASIEPSGGNYVGVMTVRLDVSSADGRQTGFTEASATVTQTAPDSDADQNQVQAALYSLTKQLMDAMNVQLQYQIQHNMSSWISYTPTAGAPALGGGVGGGGGGIQATPLGAPGAGAPAPGAPVPLTPGAPAAIAPAPVAPSGPLPPGDVVPDSSLPTGSLGTLPVTGTGSPQP
jgi:hypothetical protein